MDWKTLRREKLAKTALYSPRRWGGGLVYRMASNLQDRWGRFLAFSWGEKIMIVGAAALLAALTPMAVLALTRGDDGGGQVVSPIPTSTQVLIVGVPSATATSTLPPPTATATEIEPSPTATVIPIREDCGEIRGTPYRSPEERDWFVANCSEPDPSPPATLVPGSGPSPEPPAGPTPDSGLSAADAVSMAIQWAASEPALGEVILNTGSCTARETSDGQWRVSCRASTGGCLGEACEINVWICVVEGSRPTIYIC